MIDPSARVRQQIERGLICCPVSRRPLRIDATGTALETEDGNHRYSLWRGKVPQLAVRPGGSRSKFREAGPSEDETCPRATGSLLEDDRSSPGSQPGFPR